MIKGVRFPGRYLQGPGCITRLGREILGFGPRALVVLDGGVWVNDPAADRYAPNEYGEENSVLSV